MPDPLTGKLGAVNGVSEIANWQVSGQADLKEIFASSSKGAPITLDGNKDWSGSYKSYGHTPPVMPGEAFTFTGSVDGSKGATGAAIADSITVTVNIAAAAPIEFTTQFSGNGALTLGAAVATDVTAPNPPSSKGCKVATYNGTTETVLDNITDFTFTITAANQTYVNSSTNGLVKRLAGNITAQASYNQECDNFDALPALNAENEYRFYVTAATYWSFKWLKVDGHTPNVDVETAKVLGSGVSLRFGGFSGGVEGYIKKPGDVAFWPAAA